MSERMNKEQAKKVLKEMRNIKRTEIIRTPQHYMIDRYKNQVQALDIAIDSLDNEWVDVRDRLPKEDGHYLATVDTYADGKHYFVDNCAFVNGEFISYPTENIIAWKPLPQPYERKE